MPDVTDPMEVFAREGRVAVTPDELWTSGLLPLGRSAIYAECHRFITSEGEVGIPCIRVGRKVVIPIDGIRRWLGIQPEIPVPGWPRGTDVNGNGSGAEGRGAA